MEKAKNRLGARMGAALAAGALAAAMVPAMAFAVPVNDHLLAGTDANGAVQWPDGEWTTYDASSGSYVWSTYVKGDGGHYGHYDLDVAFKVDGDTLTAINVSSPGNAVGGAWSNNGTIVGSLPAGVENATVVDKEAKTVAPALEGAEAYGGATWAGRKGASTVAFYKAAKDGEAVTLGDAVAISADDNGVYGYADQDVNVVALTPKIGDWFSFTFYMDLGDEEYADALNKQLATDYSAGITGIGAKNRDMWTQTAYASIIEQQLREFVADDEYDLDIVSSATKSSDAVIEALYAAQGVYYPISNNEDAANAVAPAGWNDAPIFTKVSDDLAVQMDGKTVNTGKSTVEVDADGNRVLTVGFSDGFDFTEGGETAVNVVGYDLFATDRDDAVKYLLANATTAGQGAGDIAPLASTLVCARSKSHDPAPELTAEDGATELASYDPDTNRLTITDSTVTHAIVWFNHDTHANYCGVVYDLAAMAPTPEPADDPADEPADEPEAVSLAGAKVTLAKASAAYTGKAQKGTVKSVVLDGKKLVEGTDYKVSAKSGANVGSYQVTVTGMGSYAGTANATFKVTPAANKLKVKAVKKTQTAKAKAKTTIKAAKAFKVKKNVSKGKVTYAKVSGNKKITVSKSGKITVKKGLKKGKTYTVKVKASSKATKNYKAASTTVTLKVKVK
ncbi:MAG: hypothetical protein E7000_07605 [Coriobacteriaceae bacterium]|nr:hypothetical protein [Coriobacteriaceae bacterium]